MHLVVFFDLDETLIGNVIPQICEYDLNPGDKNFEKRVVQDMKNGLARPNIKKAMSSFPKGTEFFIYTMSTREWADKMISSLEKAINVKFNRPIFSRDYALRDRETETYYKSIKHIYPEVLDVLQKKHGYSFTYQELLKNCIFIDDNVVLRGAETKNLLQCKSFKYVHEIDVLRCIPDKFLLLKHFKERLKKFAYLPYSFNVDVNIPINFTKAAYYKMLSSRFQEMHDPRTDVFFKELYLNNIRKYNLKKKKSA